MRLIICAAIALSLATPAFSADLTDPQKAWVSDLKKCLLSREVPIGNNKTVCILDNGGPVLQLKCLQIKDYRRIAAECLAEVAKPDMPKTVVAW